MIVLGACRLRESIGTVCPLARGSPSALGICSTLVWPPTAWKTKICSLWSGPFTMASRSFLPLASSEAGTPT